MKKIVLAVLLSFAFIGNALSSDLVEETFDMADIERTITYFTNGGFKIEVIEERNSTYVFVNQKNVEKFREALRKAKDKYQEWKKVAEDNNIEEVIKEIDVKFPKVTIEWEYGDEKWYYFNYKLNPEFAKINGDVMLLLIDFPIICANRNRYITTKPMFGFKGDDEINEFERLISIEVVEENAKKGEKEIERKNELFK